MNKVFIVIIAGMILLSCDNGTLPDEEEVVNPLIETWVFENDRSLVIITFEENTFTASDLVKINGNTSESAGNYTYTDTIIFFEVITESSTRYLGSLYKIYDDELYLDAIPLSVGYQIFKKQL
jgi:hypothetical protein